MIQSICKKLRTMQASNNKIDKTLEKGPIIEAKFNILLALTYQEKDKQVNSLNKIIAIYSTIKHLQNDDWNLNPQFLDKNTIQWKIVALD